MGREPGAARRGLEMRRNGARAGLLRASLVNVVLSNRIRFDLHREQFDALGLELTGGALDQVRTALLRSSSRRGARRARRASASSSSRTSASMRCPQAMGEGYDAWFDEAAGADVEVSSRYGTWDVGGRHGGAARGSAAARPRPLVEL